MGTLFEGDLISYLFITIVLGGGAAYLTGRAVALTWRPEPHLVVYLAGLTFAVRFIHYALFGGTLLSVQYAILDFVVLLAFGWVGFKVSRTSQMAGQYSWLYERKSPMTWQERRQSGPPS
jgi:hypothetical protein